MATIPLNDYMVGMTRCAILIDTNIVLHFQPIEQIDWPAISGCDDCILVISPILLRELEHQKIFSRSAALRARAGRMIDFLVQKMGSPDPMVLRPRVFLHFVDHEPTIDFAVHRLVREVQDDHYIASALEYQAHTGEPTFIASNDGGMALKLRTRPIENIRLPDALRLPAEVDAEQQELREAKLTIARMQAQKPKLSLQFKGGDKRLEIRNVKAIRARIASPEQIRVQHPPLPMPEVPATAKPFKGDLASLSGLRNTFGAGSPLNIERYNEALEVYYFEYERYAVAMSAWLEQLRLLTEIELEIYNDGSATATDVDVTLRFPASIRLMRSRDWPSEPKAPQPPAKPGSTRAALGMARDLAFPDPRPFDLNLRDGAVYVCEDAGEVRFSCASLKQKCQLRADKFLLTRDAALTGRGIEVEADITYHQGEPIEQKLAITFTEVDPPEPVTAGDDA